MPWPKVGMRRAGIPPAGRIGLTSSEDDAVCRIPDNAAAPEVAAAKSEESEPLKDTSAGKGAT